MSCPINEKRSSQAKNTMLYGDYLKLDKILTAQKMLSPEIKGKTEHDEHLFIIIHQTYELWFKQIIYELDLVCELFNNLQMLNYSEIIKRLHRIVMILKLLVDQVLILETMTSMDFHAFRDVLDNASGFQSLQFRTIEYKLGLKHENRSLKFNQSYNKILPNNEKLLNEFKVCQNSSTFLQQIEKWLEATPHLDELWGHYKTAIETKILTESNNKEMSMTSDDVSNQDKRSDKTNDTAIKRMREQYAKIFDKQLHDALLKRGERKLSLRALQGAIIISLYKDEAFFATSHQILMLLVDIDSMLSRWRYNHVLMVQRMIGSTLTGTGGSSGYQYLRSTLSDRYKPFVDITNLATFLISKRHLPALKHFLNSKHLDGNGRSNDIISFCNGKEANEEMSHEETHRNCYKKKKHTIERLSNDFNGKSNYDHDQDEFDNEEIARKYNRHVSSIIPDFEGDKFLNSVTYSDEDKKELESSFESCSSSGS